MGKFYETIPESVHDWILDQAVFWVATAPLSATGHVNVSPKGGKQFGLLDDRTFWYGDLTGSGVETLSHLYESGNGRITILFNAFKGAPQMVRLWGSGRPLEYGTESFNNFLLKHKPDLHPGTRSVIIVDVHQVGTSCGWSMPFFDFVKFRPTLDNWMDKRVASEKAGKEEDGLERYWAYKNAVSMDGLPGMQRGVATAQTRNVEPIEKMIGPWAPENRRRSSTTLPSNTFFIALLSFILGLVVASGSMALVNYRAR